MFVFSTLLAAASTLIKEGEGEEEGSDEETFGWYRRSGKMIVVHSLLKIWKKQVRERRFRESI